MKIKHIQIQNFKGIVDQTYEFNQQFTVMIGDNGSGKSSILDAISIGLGTYLMKTGAAFGLNGKKTRPLRKDEIRTTIISEDHIVLEDVCLNGVFTYDGQELDWHRDQSNSSSSLSYKNAAKLTKLGQKHVSLIKEAVSFPLIAYHSTARLAGEIHGKTGYEKIGSRLDGYYACLDPRSIKEKFMSWFKTYEDEVLKFNKDKALYMAFTNTISSLIESWSEIKFSWKFDDLMGKVDENKWMPMSHLSDGYRSIVSLAADIAYRAIKLNPHLGEKAVLETTGIVLIDEIDMHLHPKWQRRIVADLKRVFPNIQFIVTTHSPFIVQSLKADEVINLDGNIPTEEPDNLSLEDNAIFMGVENEYSDQFSKEENIAYDYMKLLEKEPDDSVLEQLEQLIDKTTDPIFKAKLQLERLAKFGK